MKKIDLIDTEPDIKWNILKLKAIELSQQFGRYNKIQQKQDISKLREKLNYLEQKLGNDNDNPELIKEIFDTKNKLHVFLL